MKADWEGREERMDGWRVGERGGGGEVKEKLAVVEVWCAMLWQSWSSLLAATHCDIHTGTRHRGKHIAIETLIHQCTYVVSTPAACAQTLSSHSEARDGDSRLLLIAETKKITLRSDISLNFTNEARKSTLQCFDHELSSLGTLK